MFNNILNWIISILNYKPIPSPIPPPAPPSTDFANQLLKLHNARRAAINVPLLTLDVNLINSAQKHSNWMNINNTMSHYENGRTVGDRVKAEGYIWNWVGENIAEGYRTANDVFDAWMSDYGHKVNIENPHFKDVGFGLTGGFWTTDFGSKSISGMCSVFNFNTSPGGIRNDKS